MKMKSNGLFLLWALLMVVQLSAADKIEMKINLGGEAVDGFSAEQEFLELGEDIPKMRFHGAISGNGNDANVFKTQRFSRESDLVLNIPVPDGIYTVTLLFAETWNGAYAAGKRVFDVRLNVAFAVFSVFFVVKTVLTRRYFP